MTTVRKRFPEAVQVFVMRQAALPATVVYKADPGEQHSPYGSWWYRAVAGMLQSGRVKAKADGYPNRTEINRTCKEANFNQYLFERIARFLTGAEVVKADWQGPYGEGPNAPDFWGHEPAKLQTVTRRAVLRLTGFLPWRPTTISNAGLAEFLTLFFACLEGQAVPESRVGQAWHDFAQLPESDLKAVADMVGVKLDGVAISGWRYWFNEQGRQALLAALYDAEWIWYVEHRKEGWILPSPVGLGMLGLGTTPPPPELPVLFKVLPNLSIFAGSGLILDKLVPLFRHCLIKRIDQVFEFQLDPRRLATAPAQTSPGTELREALKELEPLPSVVASLLETRSKLGGKVAIRWCSALVKPESAEVLQAIRQHPQLKGYLEPKAPPGYLLLKSQSRPDNFVRRCEELGFKVESL